MFPPTLEPYVRIDDPVRAYDAFVEAMDFGELGIIIEGQKVGSPSYYPKAMMK
jgi:transposase